MSTVLSIAPEASADDHGRLITCPVDSLQPHPGYLRHHITVPAPRLSLLAESGDRVFRDPLIITRDRIIIDGYARWELARQQGRPALPCLEYDLPEVEALHWLLQKHRLSNGLNDFCRILLALGLEPLLREQARSNQQLGGQRKGSSNLTEADRLDVREKIAAAASVSTGTLTKATHLASDAHPQVLEALRSGDVNIHRASLWLKTPEKQLDQLRLYQGIRGITRTIGSLQRLHRLSSGDGTLELQRIARALAAMPPEQREVAQIGEIQTPRPGHPPFQGTLAGIDSPGRTPAMNSEHPPHSGYRKAEHPIKTILELTRDHWDHPGVHPDVRDNFRKVLLCRTPALGAEVYASAAGEKVFYHTCKSKCCPSCGYRATLLWLREQWVMLPDIPFVGIVLTMPDLFWPVFKAHRHLQHDLPALGAAVLQQWAWTRYRVRLCVVVVQHTFGGRLNYNPHLHIMVSAGGLNPAPSGLNPAKARWVESLKFDPVEIKSLWRFAVCSYLRKAHRDGLLRQSSLTEEFNDIIHLAVAAELDHPHHPENAQVALPALCRALYPPPSYLPEAHSPGVGAGGRLPGQRHPDEDLGRGPLSAGGACGPALAACPRPLPALDALLRPAGIADETDLGNYVCSARSAPATPAPETVLG